MIIIAGGLGTRIAEETEDKPKPMVLIKMLMFWESQEDLKGQL